MKSILRIISVFVAALCVLSFAPTSVRAESVPFESLSIFELGDEGAFAALIPPARKRAKDVFSVLRSLGLVRGLFRVNGPKVFQPGLVFSKLKGAPTKSIESCATVFCRDALLQKRINDEIAMGRLVLVAPEASGFVAAIVSETPETEALKAVLLPAEKRAKKNVLVVTPKTLASTMIHELKHAADDESGVLDPLFGKTRELLAGGRLSVESGLAINRFAGEVRAYEAELRDVIDHARDVEFLADDGTEGLAIRRAPKKEFLIRRLTEIDWKVRDHYLPRFLKALDDPKLMDKDRQALMQTVTTLLPLKGPYSFAELVKPRL